MKPHIHQSAATDRMHRPRILLCALLSLTVMMSFSTITVFGQVDHRMFTETGQAKIASSDHSFATIPTTANAPHHFFASAFGMPKQFFDAMPAVTFDENLSHETDDHHTDTPEAETDDSTASDSEFILPIDPDAPLTQETIARMMELKLNKSARAGTRISYPWPSGAMAVDLYKDGKRILHGQVADIGGTVYVPVQRFADLFGRFQTTYKEATEEVIITGKNLSVSVRTGDPYITVNERIFYTGKAVLSLGGWIFVPLSSMCKALDADVTIRSGYYDAFIQSGDPSSVLWADDYYNETDLYWLSRIISAEARGEPFAGQIAVGNVVLNRVRNKQFPNTVKGVIFDRKYGIQFSPVASGTIYNTPSASAVRAAKICLEGYSLSTRMLYFYNPRIATSSWIGQSRPYIMTIGNHKFYG